MSGTGTQEGVLEAGGEEVYVFPASFGQQRLWFLDEIAPGQSTYNIPIALRMRGALNVGALEQAISGLLARQDALRTTFEIEHAEVVQVVHPGSGATLEQHDLSAVPHAAAQVEEALRLEVNRPFDLRRGPVIRFALFRLAEDHHLFLVTVHHIVADGWSAGLLLDELAEGYSAHCEGRPPELPALPVQYADFALWQREQLEGASLASLEAYWRERLRGPLPTLEIPFSAPRAASIGARPARRSTFHVPEAIARGIAAIARAERATEFITYLAAFQLLLSKYGSGEDVIVGTPMSGRESHEVEPVIGFFVNTLALRTDLSGNPAFKSYLGRVKEATLGAFANAALPFEQVVEVARPDRDVGRTPIFQAMFSMVPAGGRSVTGGAGRGATFAGLTVERVGTMLEDAKFDLLFALVPESEGYRGLITFDTDLFEDATIHRVGEHFLHLLQAIIDRPESTLSALSIVGVEERHRLLVELNDTARAYDPAATIDGMVASQVQRTPSAVAVVDGTTTLSYAALADRAAAVATRLRAEGVGPGARVGVFSERRADLVAGLLGILQVGAAYVPVDPDYPAERIRMILGDSQVSAVLVDDGVADRLPPMAAPCILLSQAASIPPVPAPSASAPDAIAYVLYTSGSTGSPKGAMIPHQALVNHMCWMQEEYPLGPADIVLQKTPIAFDASVWEFWAPLIAGACIRMAAPGMHRDPPALAALLREGAVTVVQFVPTLLQAILDEPGFVPGPRLARLYCGGEQLTPDLVSRWRAISKVPLVNLYGPTETTIDATSWVHRDGDPIPDVVPIGRPIANMRAYILDSAGELTAFGVPGELCLGGSGVGVGYFGRPELTADRFCADPFRPGERMYRTGDRVRWLRTGELEYLGRLDDQVKLRGHRIELGEVEAALLGLPGVRRAAAVLHGEPSGNVRLLAYVAMEPAGSDQTDHLRTALRERLPDYMVPARILVVEELPLTPNGKVDRKALGLRPVEDEGAVFVAPGTPTELAVAAAFGEVLHLDRIGATDDFYQLGGHSLLAIRISARLQDRLGAAVPIRMVFEHSTVATLASAIDQATPGAGALAPSGRIQALPRTQGTDAPFASPASFSQARLWFLEAAEPGRSSYGVPVARRLRGPLDLAALRTAIARVLRRQESLRTTFEMRGDQLTQVIHPLSELPFTVRDCSSAADPHAMLRSLLHEEANRPFDLTEGPIARFMLYRLSEEEHVLLAVIHHIVIDGWSVPVLLRELSEEYSAVRAGRESEMPTLPVQYVDYAVWQREQLQGEMLARLERYWQEQLAHPLPMLELPMRGPRPSVMGDRPAGRRSFRIPQELARQIDRLAQEERVTPFMVCVAALQLLLARYGGQDDVIVGVPMSGRDITDLEPVIGLFLNTLVLRTNVSGDPSGRELLSRVRDVALGAFAHQALPFERVVEVARPTRHPAMTPLFQVIFSMANASQVVPPRDADALGRFGDLVMERMGAGLDQAKFDLEFTLTPMEDGFAGSVVYDASLFDGNLVERMAGHFVHLLQGMAQTPDRPVTGLALLDPDERREVLEEWSGTRSPYPANATVHQLFATQASMRPDAIALESSAGTVTYAALAAESHAMAARLRGEGMRPGDLVGLCVERSVDMIVAMLAILKVGGAYLPLDPQYPVERLALMLADVTSPFILAHTATGAVMEAAIASCRSSAGETGPRLLLLNEQRPRETLIDPANSSVTPTGDAGGAAYVMYTSGSTGRPKGVVVPHRAIVRLVVGADYATLGPDETLLAFAPASFDAATFEVWGALLNGGRLVLAPPGVRDLADLGVLVERYGVTTLWLTSALFQEVVDAGLEHFGGVRQLLAGGDVLSVPHVRRVLATLPDCRLINGYGPTENTTFTCCFTIPREWPADRSIPVGRPIANTRVYVLDGARQPVPVGVAGELYAGGDGVALGYLNDPEFTRTRFVEDPFSGLPGARMYRTGDRVRWLEDGTIEFLGRVDAQLKIRGFRVEPGEIEAVLLSHPDIRAAVVVATGTSGGDRQLIAFASAQAGVAVASAGLRSFVASRLPAHMVPSHFEILDALPIGPTGKVDRHRLPMPSRGAVTGENAPPRTPLEEEVAGLWKAILGIDRVNVDQDFFELGGNSLLAMRLMAEIERVWGQRLRFATFFERPTISQLAEVLASASAAAEEPGVVLLQKDGGGRPFIFVHGDILGHGWYCRRLAPLLGQFPVMILPTLGPGAHGNPITIQDMASAHVATIRKHQPHGPYRLGGYCHGGLVAFEMARQLAASGEQVEALVLVDAYAINLGLRPLEPLIRLVVGRPDSEESIIRLARLHYRLRYYPRRIRQVARMSLGGILRWFVTVARRYAGFEERREIGTPEAAQLVNSGGMPSPAAEEPGLGPVGAFVQRAQRAYMPGSYQGRLDLIWASGEPRSRWPNATCGWDRVAGGARAHIVEGTHTGIVLPPGLPGLAKRIRECLGIEPSE